MISMKIQWPNNKICIAIDDTDNGTVETQNQFMISYIRKE